MMQPTLCGMRLNAKNTDMRQGGPDTVPRAARASILCVIPCLNEAEYLEALITKLLQDADGIELKVVVVDGGSIDGSQAVVQRLMEQDNRIAFLENAKRVQSAAINKALAIHGDDAEFLIRVDAHCDYPIRFCERLLAIQSQMGADSVVVTMHAKGRSCFQISAAAAQNSLLGNGGAAHRNETAGHWVDHGHHALVRISAYRAVGGYDESFSWNEDAEFDIRMRANGFGIYLAGDVSIVYFPRSSFLALFRQYFNHGRGRALNFLKHRARIRLRQVLPLAVGPAVIMSLLAPISIGFAVPAVLWSCSCIFFGVYLGFKVGELCAAFSGIAAIAMHLGWSIGFIVCLLSSNSWMRDLGWASAGAVGIKGRFR
jgi:succinoglycan biosynthesis protein ExoA